MTSINLKMYSYLRQSPNVPTSSSPQAALIHPTHPNSRLEERIGHIPTENPQASGTARSTNTAQDKNDQDPAALLERIKNDTKTLEALLKKSNK
jgi:hypothetical protein